MAKDLFPDEFDPRHIAGIVPEMRYSTVQAAEILGCSRELIIKMCNRLNLISENVDPRHYADFQPDRKYSDSEVARRFNVSHTTIFNLRKCGEFDVTPLHKVVRIPGWSIIDFIKKTASNSQKRFQFISVGNLIRIPGWGIIDYKKSLA